MLSKTAPSIIFGVFGRTRPGIECWSLRSLANTLLIKQTARCLISVKSAVMIFYIFFFFNQSWVKITKKCSVIHWFSLLFYFILAISLFRFSCFFRTLHHIIFTVWASMYKRKRVSGCIFPLLDYFILLIAFLFFFFRKAVPSSFFTLYFSFSCVSISWSYAVSSLLGSNLSTSCWYGWFT